MRNHFVFLTSLAILAILILCGCDKNPSAGAGNAAPPSNANTSGTPTKPAKPDPILTKEPDRYSETITIDVQPPGTPQDDHIPALQFGFVRYGGDRRADFQAPSIGQIYYLEHSGLKYLVIPAKKIYVELDPRELAAQLPKLSLLTPTSVVDHIKSHSKYENLGVETVNERPAVKYKFDSPGQTSTFFLDETTGLPVRAEIIGGAEGSSERIMMEMRDVQLNPDASLFDIPIGFKKMPALQMRPQVAALTDSLKRITDALAEQMGEAPPPAPVSAQASPQVSPSASPKGSAESPRQKSKLPR
ncbi:MAG TPA: hypothetical protein VEZ90_16865 [Blastocatellia bacterium]|nr:hypothetical protein [Blastocatellia bacterium]